MAIRRERAVLDMTEEQIKSLTGYMARANAAAEKFGRAWELSRATWEPHDWSDFR